MFAQVLLDFASMIEKQKRDKEIPMPKIPTEDRTKEILAKMMTEPTFHFLDSGDIYGRHWERRRKEGFEDIERVHVEIFDDGDWYALIDTFAFLSEMLEYDQKLDYEFHKFAHLPEYREEPWLTVMKEFAERIGKEYATVNTYNFENYLDQVIQYVHIAPKPEYVHKDLLKDGFNPEDFNGLYDYDECYGAIVILQTHNGCDVRGGYSTPHVFRLKYGYFTFIDAMENIDFWCPKKGCYYHLSIGIGRDPIENGDEIDWEDISLIVDTKNKVLRCPKCKSLLEADFPVFF